MPTVKFGDRKLSVGDMQFIRENNMDYTPTEFTEMFETDYNTVYNFMTKNGISMLKTRVLTESLFSDKDIEIVNKYKDLLKPSDIATLIDKENYQVRSYMKANKIKSIRESIIDVRTINPDTYEVVVANPHRAAFTTYSNPQYAQIYGW